MIIKSFKSYEAFSSIDTILFHYDINDYTVNKDGSVDIEGDLKLIRKKFHFLPIKFGTINGSFDCSHNNLQSLKNCPDYVMGNFNCTYNDLTSLEGCPKETTLDFFCNSNRIRDFGSNSFSFGNFFCSNNPIDEVFKFHDRRRNAKDFIDLIIEYQVIRGDRIIKKRLERVIEDSRGFELTPSCVIKEYELI